MTKLILIRHGQTDFNRAKKYCGHNDPSLNNEGMSQAQRLSDKLKHMKVDKIYSSDLKRAFETAQIIFRNSPVERSADFREMNFGIFEGLTYEEIIQVYPKLYRDWIQSPLEVSVPRGESLMDLSKRVRDALSRLIVRHENETVSLVTHGGPIRIILLEALGLGLDQFWQIEQNIAAVNVIEYENGKSKVIQVNGTTHFFPQEAVAL